MSILDEPGARADYGAFLAAKAAIAPSGGLDCEPSEVHAILKPHQRDAVVWAVRGGRRAVFASFGLGKTLIQLEIVRLVLAKTGGSGRGLIVCPLGVRQEFTRDARLVGLHPTFIRTNEEATGPGIYVTNYESVRDGKLDPRGFDVVSLDEAGILRGFGGTKTFRTLMGLYEGTSNFRFVATATPSPNEYIELLAYAAFLDVMDVGQAKAQPLDAKVLTPAGWRLMGDLAVGDRVVAADGRPTWVIGVYPQGEQPTYRVTFSDGSSTEATGDHLWLTATQYQRNNERRYRQRNPGEEREFETVKTTAEIAASIEARHAIRLTAPVWLDEQPVPVDAWLLGLLLGDGCLRETSVTLSNVDGYILTRAGLALNDMGLRLRKTATEKGCDYGITTTGRKGGNGPGSNPLLNALRSMALLGKRSWEKRIPAVYMFNGVGVRLHVLQGLMDSDGTVSEDGSNVGLATASEGMAKDVRWLVQSLGGTATIHHRKTTHRDSFKLAIRMPGGILSPFALPRKRARLSRYPKYPPIRYVRSIEPVGAKPAQCIAVAHPGRLYVTDDCIVTHNTRFFHRDSTKADHLTLHPHKEREFWLWVASWALFIQKPSDLGYSDEGYELPELDVRWHELPSVHAGDFDRHGRGRMFTDASLGVQEASREKRLSLAPRVSKMLDLVNESPADHFLVWHDLEGERHAIEHALPEALTVWGSQDMEERERRIIAFSDGEFRILATKPVIAGSGCNFQRYCHRAVFMGIGFKFADFIQAVHRIHRFLQPEPVRIDLIYTEAEREIRKLLERKWQQHNEQVARMAEIIREYGLTHEAMANAMRRSIGVERQEASGENWLMVNADAVEETARMEPDSVDLIVTSIPFATQYEYTPSYNDFGHTEDNSHFWRQMDYLTPHLVRVLRPGRVAAIHVKDRVVPGGMTGLGFQTVQPFHAEAIAHYSRHGLAFLGMKTIVTDVVRENNQTYRLGWTEQCKDGTKMGAGLPEYLLLFRKPPTDHSDGYADNPVVKHKARYTRSRWQIDAHGFERSSGNRPLLPDELKGLDHGQIYRLFRARGLTSVYDFDAHVAVSEALEAEGKLPVTFMLLPPPSWHPDVWTDVTRMRTLNLRQFQRGEEMHLCPLQFDIVNRLIEQFSNPSETVLDPFAGIGTVPYCAVKLGRRGVGVELSAAYFTDAVFYAEAAEREASAPTLFDLIEIEGETA